MTNMCWMVLKKTRTTSTPAFWDINCKKIIYVTHLLKLVDQMYKYKMNPTRTVGATERTWDAGRTDGRKDGRMDGRSETNTPQQLCCAGCIINICVHILYSSSTIRTTRTPALWGYPLPPHDYPYHWVILDSKSKEDKVKVTNLKNSPKFKIFEFWNKHYTRHTFWSCLIRSANMKWIW